jgi:hypothetical protein
MEAPMSVLDKVQMTAAAERKAAYDPVRLRRKKLADALQDQLGLVVAQEAGEVYRKVRVKRSRDLETDELHDVEQKRRVAPWWTIADGGAVHFRLRYGSVSLRLKDGMDVIVLGSVAELKKLLPALRQEILSGAHDGALQVAAEGLQARFTGRKAKRTASRA